MARRRVGVLISGNGSNLQALLDADGASSDVVGVISNRADAYGLKRAARAGVPAAVIAHGDYGDRDAFEAAVHAHLVAWQVEIVCLAGFMRVLSAGMVARWQDRMLNVHPSLLPAFQGLHAQAQALAAGARFAGCTVHLVRAAVDAGPIVAQAVVPVRRDDDVASLSARILAAEHACYPLALELLASGRARVVGERVVVDGEHAAPETLWVNPVA